MSGFNLPPGVTQHDIDVAAGYYDEDEETSTLGAEDCAQCGRAMEENYRGIWYRDGVRMGHEPIPVKGEVVCSQLCKSQFIYESLNEADKEVLRDLAKAAYKWFTTTEGAGLRWRLQHSAIATLVGPLVITAVEVEIRDLLKELAGTDFLDGKEDGPKWFQEAVGIAKGETK